MTPDTAAFPETDPRGAATEAAGTPPTSEPLYQLILPLLGVGSLLAACVIWSVKKQLWGDELFTWFEIRDPSFAHLLHAVPHLGGGGMPLFYLTAWPWVHSFGLTALSLRLYSSIAMGAAFLLLTAVLGRRFGARAAFLGVGFAFFTSLVILDQNDESRGYGLYLLLFVLAFGQWMRVAETPRPRPRDLVLLILTQAALILGHILALFYGGLMLLALVLADLWRRELRPRVYLCCALGWLALLPWIPAIRASMAVGKPHSWIPLPGITDLATGLSFGLFAGIYFPLLRDHPLGLLTGMALALGCVAALVLAGWGAMQKDSPTRRPVYLLAFLLVAAPLLFFLVSYLISPVFVLRYMTPSIVGVAILCVSWVGHSRAGRSVRSAVYSMVILVLPLAAATLARPQFLDVARVDQLTMHRPVVCPWLRDFMVMERYSAHPASMEYPMDRAVALAGRPAAIGGFNLMRNYRAAGYLRKNLMDGPAVLSQPSFVVLDNSDTDWFRVEIQENPEFSWKVLARIDKDHRLLAVERKP